MKKILKISVILLLTLGIASSATIGSGVDLPGPIGSNDKSIVYHV